MIYSHLNGESSVGFPLVLNSGALVKGHILHVLADYDLHREMFYDFKILERSLTSLVCVLVLYQSSDNTMGTP